MYTVNLAKEPFKFSCSHFTILGPDKAERLHGHNYQVRVTIAVRETDPKLGLAFDFNSVKPLIRAFCDELDERILLPRNSPYLKVEEANGQVEVRFGKKRYAFPKEDTLSLPLVNITTEELSRFACERLVKDMQPLPYWTHIKVSVEETRGQSVSYQIAR
jgi:6-pyruvoyltetrahydropterin/6-carboxytetrahydropterin synthase